MFTKNRDRLIAHDVAGAFLRVVIEQARAEKLMSSKHFTVDGTLIESWASLKSFKKKDRSDDKKTPPDDPGNPTVDFRGEKRSNETHQSTTDPDARLARKKGQTSKLSYSAHALIENRNGLVVDLQMDIADGFAERRNALVMLDNNMPGKRRITLGADKGYDTRDFVEDCRMRNVTPHVSQNITERRGSNIDARTTSSAGYPISQRIRKRVEEVFGWIKTVGMSASRSDAAMRTLPRRVEQSRFGQGLSQRCEGWFFSSLLGPAGAVTEEFPASS